MKSHMKTDAEIVTDVVGAVVDAKKGAREAKQLAREGAARRVGRGRRVEGG